MIRFVFRRVLALAAMLAALSAFLAAPASAATDATTGHASLLSDTLIVSYLVTAVLSYGIPYLTDVLTKSAAPTYVKNLVAVALSALAAVIPTVTFVHGERWTDYLLGIVIAFGNAMIAHKAGFAGNAQTQTANFGIGPDTPALAVPGNDVDDSDADAGDAGGSLPPAPPLGKNANDLPGGNV